MSEKFYGLVLLSDAVRREPEKNITDLRQHIVDVERFMKTAPINEGLVFSAPELLDENLQVVRKSYESLMIARWYDYAGNFCFQSQAGDTIVLGFGKEMSDTFETIIKK